MKETRRGPVSAALVVFLLTAGCGIVAGSDSAREARRTSATSSPASSEGERNSKVSGTPAPTARPTPTSTSADGPKRSADRAKSPTPGPSPTISFTAKLDKACVRRGAIDDLQGLTVRTEPGDHVIFSTSYSDGSNELGNPSYKTGHGSGVAAKGTFRQTWVVPEEAPTGEATVTVLTSSSGGRTRELEFTVVGKEASCP